MIITQKPAYSIVAGDILVYDFYIESERKTAKVVSSSTNEKDTTITYIDNEGMFAGKPFTFVYSSNDLLNCVDIAALAGAEPEEMESRESWLEQARRKEQEG